MLAVDLLRLACGLLPSARLKNWLLRRLGWDVARTAHIAPCVLWRIQRVRIADHCYMGLGNVVRALDSFTLDQYAVVGGMNLIAGPRAVVGARTFTLGVEASITYRHTFDCSAGITIGKFTTIAGVGSVFLTHGIDIEQSRQVHTGIEIGDYCLISSNVCFTPGAVVGPRSQIAMGAVVHGNLEGGALYGGVPARRIKAIDGAYFSRPTGPVSGKRFA
jgi:acetyltransferase-like isoleucine patch superfamily enzyme